MNSRRVVVLDANVLYGIENTDLLLTLAVRNVFRAHWSPEISTKSPGTSANATTSTQRQSPDVWHR